MAFIPSSSHVLPVGKKQSASYVPTSKDMLAPGQNEPQASDMTLPSSAQEAYKNIREKNLEEMNLPPEEMRRRSKEVGLGLAQGVANIPLDIANWIRKEPLQRFQFAPETGRSKVAQMVAPFMTPATLEMGTTSALAEIPRIGRVMNELISGIRSRPILNLLTRSAKGGAEVGLTNALLNPESPGEAFTTGAEFGAPASALAQLVGSVSPYTSVLAKAGLGGLIGSQFGHPFYGAAAGLGIPLRASMGIESQPKIAEEMLAGLNPRDVARSVAANERLGTTVTPAEASGNYVVAGREGGLKRTTEGARLGYRAEEMQKHEQRRAINAMLDNIYRPTAANERMINSLYQQSYQMNINPRVVTAMRSDPIMDEAFETVRRMPEFRNIPDNNYEFLAQVDRQLYKNANALANSANGADRVRAFDIQQVKNSYNNFLKQANPQYAQATEAAQPRIVRRNIEEKLNKEQEDFTAKNFYSRMLNRRQSYRDLLRDTRNFPEAQQMIRDMRTGWKHLANMKTTSQAESQSKTALDQARNIMNFIKTTLKSSAGSRGDINRLNYIYGNQWARDFARLANIRDLRQRQNAMLEFIAKSGTAYGLQDNQLQNLVNVMTQGSGENGSNVLDSPNT